MVALKSSIFFPWFQKYYRFKEKFTVALQRYLQYLFNISIFNLFSVSIPDIQKGIIIHLEIFVIVFNLIMLLHITGLSFSYEASAVMTSFPLEQLVCLYHT